MRRAQLLMSRSTEKTTNTGPIRTERATPSAVEPQPPQSAPSPSALHEGSTADGWLSFDTYRKSMAERASIAERRRGEAEDLITSAALLAATVSVFIGASIPGLRPDPRETSAFYLARASQMFANASGVQIDLPFMPRDPANFSPSRPAVWINTLWFLSLAMSLSCILLASSLQRWAHRLGHAGLDRADQGDELRITWLAIALPVVLRISISLFYTGLAVLLFDSLRIHLGIPQALFLTSTSIIAPLILLFKTT